MIVYDKTSNNAIFECDLPEGFVCEAQCKMITYPQNRKLYVEMNARRENCLIRYQTGEEYLYVKKQPEIYTYLRVPPKPQDDSGAWYKTPASLYQDLDDVVEKIIGKKVDAKAYYDLSQQVAERLEKNFKELIDDFVQTTQVIASFSQVPVGADIRNYLFDGGIGVYEDEGKTVAVCLSRMGMEIDVLQRPGILENLSDQPFGEAQCGPNVYSSNCTWNVPFILYMISDNKQDLKVFFHFADTLRYAEGFEKQIRSFKEQLNQYQIQKAQSDAMRNQAMWNTAFANQQQQFASMDRMSEMLRNDLDSFRSGLNQQMAQNDLRFEIGNDPSESLDDRIQRMRHESIMGVETYQRNDGSTVEYSNNADRVFENNLDPLTHFGTSHYYDDFVPEGWHEIKKK